MEGHDTATGAHYRCFRCESGCVHLVCGHTMLTLSPNQFLQFADTISAMRHEILEENDPLVVSENDSIVVM
jgi:hypothetical protein